MEGIQVSVSKTGSQNNISVIKVGGYIDTTTSAELERSLDRLLRAGHYNIVVDLGNVDYISSAGWGIFISEIKGIREKSGDLKLANMIPDVYEVFELLEFHYILKAFDSTAEAVKDFEKDLFSSGSSRPQEEFLKEESSEEKSGGGEKSETPSSIPSPFGETKSLSLQDRIRKAVLEKPDASLLEIKNELNTEKYGFTKIGIFPLWRELGKLRLRSKKKRIAFFKQNAFSK
ncbi:anti-sigma-B factor antagonist [bacterium BMS3Abin05]|nr:anti-sigma-B factor antagonist [bacterium BMS3Abin05]GBE28513.1 anti-sigma-B factor antagonist [bacterium BMS3Bbin03]HDK35435.1 anti-sigma factor antagonist [Bacteroidota bacterium]HDZ12597.1 anti-sigma factor antagonist [Bacteroidota bacterium]